MAANDSDSYAPPETNTEEHSASLAALDSEIRRFEGSGLTWPRFARRLETRFQRDTSVERVRLLLGLGMLSLFAYDLLIVGDYYMDSAHLERAALVRFGVVTPLVLLLTLLVRGRSRHIHVRELVTSFLSLLAIGGTLFLHHGISALVSVEAQMELALILVSVNCLFRIDLRYAAPTSALAILLNLLFIRSDQLLSTSHKMVSTGMLSWMVVLTLTVNYALTRERRFGYLLQLRSRMQRDQLADANAELLALSATDRLTGLPNRRAYDAHLAELWQLCQCKREPLSAVMVDVDHFKRLNDTHGHPYGDRVLQRVASLIQQAMRGESDFVARYGGEEFVVLLPNADTESAGKVAERIRTLVQVAGSPALLRDTPTGATDVWSTVSCGVSSTWPTPEGNSARLIADADAALYRAKQTGRNRVAMAPSITSPSKIRMFPSSARA